MTAHVHDRQAQPVGGSFVTGVLWAAAIEVAVVVLLLLLVLAR